MAGEQNEQRMFASPTFSQEIFESHNASYKLFLEVYNFSGYVRVGITKKIFCEATESYVHAAKGHCYFPAEVCEKLNALLSIVKAEAERLETQVDGHTKAGERNGYSSFVRAKPYNRRINGNAAPLTFTTIATSTSDRQSRGKRRVTEAYTVEQGPPKKRDVGEASEEPIQAKTTQDGEHAGTSSRA
jgi:hypothetical protein